MSKFDACRRRARRLEGRWRKLCDRHLPLAPEGSVWRYRRAPDPARPAQGWKLHVSATLLNACETLERAASLLSARAVEFKAPRSLKEVIKINSGLFYGYSQVGKIVTVYPRSAEEAVALARELYELTRRLDAPAVPFDLKFGGNVYYRFGAFAPLEIEHESGRRTPAIRDPRGALVPDLRVSERAAPDWACDPLAAHRPPAPRPKPRNPLAASFAVFDAIVQRGKGGVYRAVDLRGRVPRPCLLKEGRRSGETSWDGRDGARVVRHEERVISELRAAGVDAPRIYSSFELGGNHYLVTEFIEGESLQNLMARRERRLSVPAVLRHGLQIADIFRRLHAAGWVWRDCKPANILVTPEGRLRPLDFEGACRIDEPDPLFWGTPGFTPPEWADPAPRTCASGDMYALGALLYLLLTGRLPEGAETPPVGKLRRDVPPGVRALVARLLARDPEARPDAAATAREMCDALSVYEVGAAPRVARQTDGRESPGGGNPRRRAAARRVSAAAAAGG